MTVAKKIYRISRTELVDTASHMLAETSSWDNFWEWVHGMQEVGWLTMTDDQVKNIINEHSRLLHGRAFDEQAALKKLPGGEKFPGYPRAFYEAGDSHSGEIPLKIDITEEALIKARELLTETGATLGWWVARDGSSWHHDFLDIHIYCHPGTRHPHLQVGPKRVCMSATWHNPVFGMIEDDDIAAIMYTCIFDEHMARHIDHYDQGFLARWLKYHGKNERR